MSDCVVQTTIGVEESRFMTVILAGVQSVMIIGIFLMVMSFVVFWDSLAPNK